MELNNFGAATGEMEGWLKKKSPKTQGSKVLDLWQRRYFVLRDGGLSYYKTEKAASLSNAESLKSIRLEQVLGASSNPRHHEMFLIDLGQERKVKLQAATKDERDAWVAAIEAAKVKAWAKQSSAYQAKHIPAAESSPHATPLVRPAQLMADGNSDRNSVLQQRGGAPPEMIQSELLQRRRASSSSKPGCCVIS